MASSATGLGAIADALKTLEDRCTLHLQTDKGNELLISSQGVCQKLLQQINSQETLTLSDCLQAYAQACLDFTYADENRLVEEEFSADTSEQRIQNVMDQFDEVIKLTTDLLPNKRVVDVLSHDLYECILWRKGALLYMSSSCVQGEDTCHSEHFLQTLQKGVSFLQNMLKVRVPITEMSEDLEFNDIETLKLLQSGIFSDVHVLALMYSGEMCYWHDKYSQTSTKSSRSSDFDAKTTGIKVLEDYISAVQGPLSDKGWNCDRAEELLHNLKDT